eukprot:Clim_evm9s33 gene=Clim_evmTU9s33
MADRNDPTQYLAASRLDNPDAPTQLEADFKCPVTGHISTVTVPVKKKEPKKDATGKAKMSTQGKIINGVRKSMEKKLKKQFGRQSASFVKSFMDKAEAAANTEVDKKMGKNAAGWTPEEIKAAQKEAEKEAWREARIDYFVWDGKQYISSQAALNAAHPADRSVPPPAGVSQDKFDAVTRSTPPSVGMSLGVFEQQTAYFPVTLQKDIELLGAMLAHIASVDGDLGAQEAAFIGGFLPPSMDPRRLASAPLSGELDITQLTLSPIRETVMLYCWIMALTDENLDAAEQQMIESFGMALQVPKDRFDAMRKGAEDYILDNVLTQHFRDDGVLDVEERASVDHMCRKLGLSSSRADESERRVRNRLGLA